MRLNPAKLVLIPESNDLAVPDSVGDANTEADEMMFSIPLSLILTALLGALLYYLPQLIQMQREKAELAAKHQDEFFAAASRILKASDATSRIVAFVAFMAENLDNTKITRTIFIDAIMGRLEKRSEKPSPKVRSLLKDIGNLCDGTKRDVDTAISSFTQSLMYSDSLLGWLLHRTIFFSARRDKQTTAAVVGETAVLDDRFLSGPNVVRLDDFPQTAQ